MSATRETALWNWLKKVKPIFKEELHINRVENSVGSGQPDVEGARKQKGVAEAIDFMIELKTSTRPADPKTKVKIKFQRSQPEWHRKRVYVRGRVFVLVQVGQASKAKRYLMPSTYVPKLLKGATEAQMEEWAIVPPVCTAAEVIEAATDPDYMP